MELIERDAFLATLKTWFRKTVSGEGHCVFIMGEAGIGKTALVKRFLQEVEAESIQYIGACDALFTPRPLAPLYDLALQLPGDWTDRMTALSSRTELFTTFVRELTQQPKPVIVVFEDIHWADAATLDFIKFLSRRISRAHCLFVLTAREDELHQQHPVQNVLGDLSPDTFTRLQLPPLSRQVVGQLAEEKGVDGTELYSISGGNPFYVNEILASYSPGIPDNVKDAVLSVYNRQDAVTKNLWQLLSVIPEGIELTRLDKLEASWQDAIDQSLAKKILLIENGKLFFKHELYRRTIEASLSPFKRIALNKQVLQLFQNLMEAKGEIERIVHHAKNANEHALVFTYAPVAARQAKLVGAHLEAATLYRTAIEYAQDHAAPQLVPLYEAYAYECHLTNQIKEAIIYQNKAFKIWNEAGDVEKIGNALWFLSRLWWFDGNHAQAHQCAAQAIEVLENQPSSKAKAMAYANMAQLKMYRDLCDECLYWGKKAVAVAEEIGDEETKVHALVSMGIMLMLKQATAAEGIAFLEESLETSLRKKHHEYVARAYSALGSNSISLKNYPLAKKNLEAGIRYCEEHDLDSLRLYMLSWLTRYYLETGAWNQADQLTTSLLKYENLAPAARFGALTVAAALKIRRGEHDARPLLNEAEKHAHESGELFRIVLVFMVLLEYEWLSGKTVVDSDALLRTINRMVQLKSFSKRSRFYFWLRAAGKAHLVPKEGAETYALSDELMALDEVAFWEKTGSPYELALSLFEGDEDSKRRALSILEQLGATAVCEKFKQEMRQSGIKKIPRGLRDSTKSNPAQLTNRELEVLQLLKEGIQNKEIAQALFLSPKTVDHHISSILFKLDVTSRTKAVAEAVRLEILK